MSNGFQIEENKSQGFIKLYRSFIRWEWYDDSNTKALFLHCLLKANHESTKWRGQIIERGSFVTSLSHLACELNLTIKQVRTCINKLKTTGEVAHKGNNRNSIITINNYDFYQEKGQTKDNQGTKVGQSEDKQGATNKNEKNIKNDKNKKNNFVAKSFFQKLFTDDSEYQKNNSHLKDLFIEFLEYKTAIKKQFKTESGVENAFKDFIRLSENNAELGRALVDNSIARGWQSIYDLSAEQRKAFKNAQIKNQQMNDKNYGGF